MKVRCHQILCETKADTAQAQCQLFSTTFNPEGLRLGNKVLRKRLLGPTLTAWYPPKLVTHKDMLREFAPYELTVDDQKEDQRRDHIAGFVFLPTDTLKGIQPDQLQLEVPREERTKEEEGSSGSDGYVIGSTVVKDIC
jgi:hypothetical protein